MTFKAINSTLELMKKPIFFLFLFLGAATAFGQAKDSLKHFSIGFSPQYLVQNALRLDFGLALGDKRHNLGASPYFYYGQTRLYQEKQVGSRQFFRQRQREADKVGGFGLACEYKYRLSRQSAYGYPFFSVGSGFHRITLQYKGFGWRSDTEDGVKVLRGGEHIQKEQIKRLDLVAVLGYRLFMFENFTSDFTLGAVYRKAWITHNLQTPRNHQDSAIKHGFEGILPRVRFSFSLLL